MSAHIDTPEWRAAACLDSHHPSSKTYDRLQEQRRNSWKRAASRHADIVCLLQRGRVSDKIGATAPDQKESVSYGRDGDCSGYEEQVEGQGQHQLPFHPLHCAASQGMTTAARMLLQNQQQQQRPMRENVQDDGPEKSFSPSDLVNTRDAVMGCTPLHWAAIANRVEFMRMLLDHGARVNSSDHEGRTPLYFCAAFGAADAASLLLEKNADHHGTDRRGLTPLHAAAAGGHLEVAEELLSAGADVRKQAAVGAMPRHIAERHGHSSMVDLLVAADRRRRLEEADIAASLGRNSMMHFGCFHGVQDVEEAAAAAAAARGEENADKWLINRLRVSLGG